MLTFDTLWYHGPVRRADRRDGLGLGPALHRPALPELVLPAELRAAPRRPGSRCSTATSSRRSSTSAGSAIALLAAWCIGRPYGVAPLTLVAVALVLDIGPMVPREAGTPANDVAPVALLLAAAAVLVNAAAQARGGVRSGADPPLRRPPAHDLIPMGAILVAGLAMGLALGTKLTIAGGLAAMAVGLPLVLPGRDAPAKALLVFLGGVAATAGFWFLRNLIHSGNPLPWAQELGPIDLPGPDRGLEGRDNYTVAHYIFETPTPASSASSARRSRTSSGPLWPLFFVAASARERCSRSSRPRTPIVRLLGVVAVVGAIAYLFTPLTAAGPAGPARRLPHQPALPGPRAGARPRAAAPGAEADARARAAAPAARRARWPCSSPRSTRTRPTSGTSRSPRSRSRP